MSGMQPFAAASASDSISHYLEGFHMASEVKSSRVGSAVSVAVGERVTVGDAAAEYVLISVDHATGRLELLRLNPTRIESEIPASEVRRTNQGGPRAASEGN
jgi:hypothetical protein